MMIFYTFSHMVYNSKQVSSRQTCKFEDNET
jgi:hypothetical protein